MGFRDFLDQSEPIISIDIGSHSIKLIEMEIVKGKPLIAQFAFLPLTITDVFQGQQIAKKEEIAEELKKLIEQVDGFGKRVNVSVSAPAVFCKRVRMSKMGKKELADNIQFEAASVIPHSVEAVKLDYQVIRAVGKGQMEVLVVAVKNEVVDSYLDVLAMAELEAAVIDIDYFASQNAIELIKPEVAKQSVAIIHIGQRYSAINIVRKGVSIVTGDLGASGKAITDMLVEKLGLSAAQAEAVKRQSSAGNSQGISEALELISGQVDKMAAEYNRHLSLLWGSADVDGGIDSIILSGGSANLVGLANAIQGRTGIETTIFNPFEELETLIDVSSVGAYAPAFSLAIGMGIRQAGDRIFPELDND